MTLRKIRLNAQGYDREGEYYGTGQPVYRFEILTPIHITRDVRAWTRGEAIDKLWKYYSWFKDERLALLQYPAFKKAKKKREKQEIEDLYEQLKDIKNA